MKKSPFIILGVIVLVAIGMFVLGTNNKDSIAPTNSGATSSNSANSATKSTTAVSSDVVEIKNYAYGPAAVSVKVGTTVTWTNQDDMRHDVASDDDAFTSSSLLAKGESYTYTFTKAGTYTYHCSPHPYMKGSVVVTE